VLNLTNCRARNDRPSPDVSFRGWFDSKPGKGTVRCPARCSSRNSSTARCSVSASANSPTSRSTVARLPWLKVYSSTFMRVQEAVH
jgi:hypothetical protein